MAEDVLSQSEIDKLLSALSDGSVSAEEVKADEEQKKVKTYDFKRPDKFSKDQIRTLFMLHESFSRLLNTYLSTHLRTMVNVEVASVEQLTYQEFVQSLANPSVISILAVPPLKGNIIMEVNTEIAFAFIDRVFGGEGKSGIKTRVLTEIEEAVMRRFVDKATSHLKEAWANVVEFYPSLEATESNPQFTQIVPPSDMVVIVTIQMKVGEVEGMMNICIPYLVLEPIMKLEVTSPQAQIGNVIADLTSRRGRVTEVDSQDMGIARVVALVPLGELFGYASSLRSLSGGRGDFVAEPSVYAPL